MIRGERFLPGGGVLVLVGAVLGGAVLAAGERLVVGVVVGGKAAA